MKVGAICGGGAVSNYTSGYDVRRYVLGFGRDAALALARHPLLLFEAARASVAMRRKGGFGLAGPYLNWRFVTAYGEEETTASAQDLLDYLSWRREMRSIRKWEREA